MIVVYKKMYNFAQKYIGDVLTTYNVYVTAQRLFDSKL